MYKVIGVALAAVSMIVLSWVVFPIKESDKKLFEELSKSSNPESNEATLSYSQQKRQGVCKQIWYQDDEPLYFRIDSEESELFFFRQNHTVEVIEQLGKVKCLMQEELYFEGGKPMQRIRYLEAESACYNYNSHLFVGENVKLWKYALPGHLPPTAMPEGKPLMQAVAQSIEFTLKGEKLNFIAHRMKATLNSNDRSL